MILSHQQQIERLRALSEEAVRRDWGECVIRKRPGDVVTFYMAVAPYLEVVAPDDAFGFDLWDSRTGKPIVMDKPIEFAFAALDAVHHEVMRLSGMAAP